MNRTSKEISRSSPCSDDRDDGEDKEGEAKAIAQALFGRSLLPWDTARIAEPKAFAIIFQADAKPPAITAGIALLLFEVRLFLATPSILVGGI